MKKAGILIIGLIVAFAVVTNVCAQIPPKPDKVQLKPSTHVGNVVTMQGTTLTVTGGGKGGQTAFNTATASWVGYASPSQVQAGDSVNVTYWGTVGGLKKAITVTKQSTTVSGGGPGKVQTGPKSQ
jgi:hypothetical protein